MIINKPANNRFVFTLFFMDHMLDKTGISRFMLGQQKMFLSHGISYVSAFIIRRAYFNDRIEAFNQYGLLVDGEYQGVFSISQLIERFAGWNRDNIYLLDFHIHHFLHVKLHDLETFLNFFSDLPIKVYLHDHYTSCISYNLMKNDEQYCGGRGLTAEYCNGCSFYKESVKYENKLSSFLKAYIDRIMFIAPSESTKEIFFNFHPEYSGKVRVIPHLKLSGRNPENRTIIDDSEPLRIAFLGYPNPRKGWDVFNRVIERYKNDTGFEFYVFNSDDREYRDMKKIRVQFSENSMDSMTKALVENGIHAVLLWSLWPETYSYVFFESFGANTFVLTYKDSGNLADATGQYGNGRVFGNEEELMKYLDNRDSFRKDINSFRTSEITGPEEQIDNDEILSMISFSEASGRKTGPVVPDRTNPLLMKVLNHHYDKRFKI